MLKRLYISNFALIGEMDVSFPGGLTVITGETGAGKSIFLEALALVLGNRADLTTLRNKSKKCIVEAEFQDKEESLKAFFIQHDLDYEPNLILRREINADGKSRSFLNDSAVTLNTLKDLSDSLIDIHSQHQTRLLNAANFQMELLDAFAGSFGLYAEYRQDFQTLGKLKQQLKTLTDQEIQARKELDYYQFLFQEFEELDLKPGQLKEWEEESEALENAEGIKSSLLSAAGVLQGGEQNVLGAIVQARQSLSSISKYNKQYQEFFERIQSTYVELKELAAECEQAESSVQFDQTRLEELNAKMDKLNRLLNKHHVKTEEELMGIRAGIEDKLTGFQSLENQIEKTNKEIRKQTTLCLEKAREISKLRHAAKAGIELQVKEVLGNLSMENASFKIEISTGEELASGGIDSVKFLFSANKGGVLSELSKVASGGELSRLMLTLKSLLASKKNLPAIVFDEIDTGVSGEVADKIGRILWQMGKHLQVITITHLPQMASKGKHHLFVYKKDDEDKTVSYIKQLNEEERVLEIAKMLSAGVPGKPAIENAKVLLEQK